MARTYLCRAWIDAVLDDAARAFTGALFAAWACDDSGLEAAAAELRAQAIEYWMAARDAGAPADADCAIGVSEAVRAEMLRRSGRFAESVEQAVARARTAGGRWRHGDLHNADAGQRRFGYDQHRCKGQSTPRSRTDQRSRNCQQRHR